MAYTGPLPNIAFTDTIGAATMSCVTPRFASWTPSGEDVGAEEVVLGTGQTFKWTYRRDYYATFDITNVTQNNLTIALRLKLWLEAGNSVTVQTFDTNNNVYTCYMWPKKVPTIGKYDKVNQEYTLTLNLLNTANAPLIAQYSGH